RMSEYFATKKADCLIMQDETRLGQCNTKIALFHQLSKEHIPIYTSIHNGKLEISESDSMVLQIVGIVEEYQRKNHNTKIKRGMQKAIKQGYNPTNNLSNRNKASGRKRKDFPIEEDVSLRENMMTLEENNKTLNGLG